MNRINHSSYWLTNAHIPRSLVPDATDYAHNFEQNADNLVRLHLLIKDGKIADIQPHFYNHFGDYPQIDQQLGIILPCFIDGHTHLDKGHIWQRTPNHDRTFIGAIDAVFRDYCHWSYDDLYKRMEFGLRCSYAHGTRAIRTHLDCPPPLRKTTIALFQSLQNSWQSKITLQPVSLVTLDQYAGDAGEDLARQIAEIGGVLGGVAYMNPYLDQELDRLFFLAQKYNLDVDLHTDENGDADSCTLLHTAQAVLRNNFLGKVNCGHCCSLSVQTEEDLLRTIALVKEANISIISLPLCNLYLQDRQENITPRWRGITTVQELASHGIPVALASDNCRDPFYGFGDHDLLQVFSWSVQIAHLDRNYDHWINSINQIPSAIMNLTEPPLIRVGLSADLVIFTARYYSELLSRPQHDRVIIRQGKVIDSTLPSYRELDNPPSP